VVHLRLVVPRDRAERVVELLCGSSSVQNVVRLPRAAQKPEGDVVLCDVAREDASVILDDLRELNIPRDGSIAVELIDTAISRVAQDAEKAAAGLPSDAVVWEELESRTSENTDLSFTFVAFMVLAMLIASVGLLLDQPILIVGAMVVGPEFGPLAGACVAVVEQRRDLARRSFVAIFVGFTTGIALTVLATLVFRWTGLAPTGFTTASQPLTGFVSQPDTFSFVVAVLAGMAGMLSLTSAKSGALIGVVISVTTIPAAANVGVAAAYADVAELLGSLGQLLVNLGGIVLSGVLTLYVQRRLYLTRRRKHREELGRAADDAARPATDEADPIAR
jgi:uncharacterized hydrophobic protein (TIGR00271 family)